MLWLTKIWDIESSTNASTSTNNLFQRQVPHGMQVTYELIRKVWYITYRDDRAMCTLSADIKFL